MLASAAGLLAALYAAQAEALLSVRQSSDAGIAAYRLATQLAPQALQPQSELAGSLLGQGKTDAARVTLIKALWRAPADADLWLKYSVMQLGCARCYPQLAVSAARVNTLAPRQSDLQSRQAWLALAQWPYADTATLNQWRYSLAQSLNDPAFQHELIRREVSIAACAELASAWPALNQSCRDR